MSPKLDLPLDDEFRRRSSLPSPRPSYDSPHQSGITDPRWPVEPPDGVDPEDYADYRGRVEKQDFVAVVRANVRARDRNELAQLLLSVTRYAYAAMSKKPSRNHMRPLDGLALPQTYRVTVTVGFGATLFVDKTGVDRYGIRSFKPTYLKVTPQFPGDDEGFHPLESATDLVFVIASDHPYVNVAIARDLSDHFNDRFRKEFPGASTADVLEVTGIEQGFARPDKREFLRFDDGVDNLRAGPPDNDLERLVYVGDTDDEPDWCVGGAYFVYRKIHENLPVWEAFSTAEQSGMIGRDKESSRPLSREVSGDDDMTPVFPDPHDSADGPLDAHIRKVQPRRPGRDLFGLDDLERRFLRRPYPYFEGLDSNGKANCGLQFLAYMKSIQHQFEHVTNMWQMNPDFPVPGTGIDTMYRKDIFRTVDGGYYFFPPAPKDEQDFFGSAMLAEPSQEDTRE